MTLTFIHGGSEADASYRYRAQRPAEALGATINDGKAECYIFAKPHWKNLETLQQANAYGHVTILDTCDIHWQHPGIKTMMHEAHYLTVNTPYLQQMVQQQFGRASTIIPDPYEYEELPPHCDGNHILWFGHPTNGASFNRFSRFVAEYPYEVVTNKKSPDQNVTQWSVENLRAAFARADLVIMPETAPYKSCNRTIESIRQGCFVVAEPHPSLVGFPGIWIGNIKEGVAWTIAHPAEARRRTVIAQQYVKNTYSLAHTVNAWKTLLTACASTWEQAKSIGTAGSTSMRSEVLATQS